MGSLTAKEELIRVLNPRGKPSGIERTLMAPRLDTLDGKTVYLVDIRYSGGYSFFQEMMDWFSKNMPKMKTVFKQKSGHHMEDDPALWAEIKEKGNAVIMGVGH